MKQILEEQDFQKTDCVSDACAVEVGQLLGAQKIVVGTIGVAGEYTVLSIRALDVATGEVIMSETVRTRGGIERVMDEGIVSVVNKVRSGFFGDTAQSSGSVSLDEKQDRVRRGVLVGAGGALFAGAGVAAFLLLRDDDPEDEETMGKARIVLP
jgi:hypothetical protein